MVLFPLPGVAVSVKGTGKSVSTDIDGNYRINADSDGTLVFSYVGKHTLEEKSTTAPKST